MARSVPLPKIPAEFSARAYLLASVKAHATAHIPDRWQTLKTYSKVYK